MCGRPQVIKNKNDCCSSGRPKLRSTLSRRLDGCVETLAQLARLAGPQLAKVDVGDLDTESVLSLAEHEAYGRAVRRGVDLALLVKPGERGLEIGPHFAHKGLEPLVGEAALDTAAEFPHSVFVHRPIEGMDTRQCAAFIVRHMLLLLNGMQH